MDAFRDALRQLRFRLQGLLSYTSWGSEQFWISLSSLILCQPSSKLGPPTFAILSSFYPSPRLFAGVFCTEVRLRCNSLPFVFAPGRFSCSLGWLLSCSFPLLCLQVSTLGSLLSQIVSLYVSLAFSLFPPGRKIISFVWFGVSTGRSARCFGLLSICVKGFQLCLNFVFVMLSW